MLAKLSLDHLGPYLDILNRILPIDGTIKRLNDLIHVIIRLRVTNRVEKVR